jgi:hypothetical protein
MQCWATSQVHERWNKSADSVSSDYLPTAASVLVPLAIIPRNPPAWPPFEPLLACRMIKHNVCTWSLVGADLTVCDVEIDMSAVRLSARRQHTIY